MACRLRFCRWVSKMQQMLTLLSCRIYSSSVFCSDTICIPVHDLEKSMRPGWGWSATSIFPPLPPGVARRPGGSSSIWWWTPWGSELDAAPAWRVLSGQASLCRNCLSVYTWYFSSCAWYRDFLENASGSVPPSSALYWGFMSGLPRT